MVPACPLPRPMAKPTSQMKKKISAATRNKCTANPIPTKSYLSRSRRGKFARPSSPRGSGQDKIDAAALRYAALAAATATSHHHGSALSSTPEHVAVHDGRASSAYNTPYSSSELLVINFQHCAPPIWRGFCTSNSNYLLENDLRPRRLSWWPTSSM